MPYLKFSSAVFCAALLLGCAAPPQKIFTLPTDYVPIEQIEIKSRYDTTEVTRESLGHEVNKCAPQAGGDAQSIRHALQDFPNKNIVAFGQASTANVFILNRTTGFCLRRSTANFPIFAAESFIDTVNPKGVPADVVDGWYKQIAMLIATKGIANTAYLMGKGDAFITTYWTDVVPTFNLIYSTVFKKAGTWEADNLDVKFSHPTLTSVTETQRHESNKRRPATEIQRSAWSEKRYPLAHRKW